MNRNFTAALLMLVLLGGAPLATARVVEGIAAIVDGDPITLSDVHRFSRRFAAVPRPERPGLAGTRRVLDLLIEERLVEKEAVKLGIVIDDAEVDRAIGDLLQMNSLTSEQLRALLRTQEMSMDDYRNEIRRELLKAKLIAREIQPRVFLSEEKVRTYYLENRERFAAPPKVRISQIFFRRSSPGAEATLRKVRNRLDAGEDFAALAREFSEDASGAQGGDLGFFTLDEVKPELRAVLADLPPEQPSDTVPTSEGFHILQITEREEGGPVPFEEVKGIVTEELFAREIDRGFRAWIENVRLKAKIEVKLERDIE